MHNPDGKYQQFSRSLESLRLELIQVHGSTDRVPSGVKDAYLEVALTGQALASSLCVESDGLRLSPDSHQGSSTTRGLNAV